MKRAFALHAAVLLTNPALAYDLPANTDPVFAEAFNACLGAIEGGGFLDESFGWTGHDSGDPDAVAWDNWSHGFATKDIPDVGGLNLSATVEDYPGYRLGHCSVRIDEPLREIDGPPLKSNGYPGSLQGDSADWGGLWRSEDGKLFIRSNYGSDPARFNFSMTQFTVTP